MIEENAGQINVPEFVANTLTAIRSCRELELIQPTLMLIYSLIDILAYLGLPPENKDTWAKKSGFESWVNTYMLGESSRIRCTARDLYASRCSVLHCGSTHSDLSRQKKAKQIFYAFGQYGAENLQEFIDAAKFGDYEDVVVLQIDGHLLPALVEGMAIFFGSSFQEKQAHTIQAKIKRMIGKSKVTENEIIALNKVLKR